MIRRLAFIIVTSILSCSFLGCGGAKVDPKSVSNSESDFDQAKTMVASGDHAGALPKLENAIKAGGLNSDMYGEALLYRAQCYAMTGNLEGADADLKAAEPSAPPEALVEFTKGVLLEKQGKAAESKAAFEKAKKLNPAFKTTK